MDAQCGGPAWRPSEEASVIENDEGNRLLRVLRRGTGSVVTWRRAQMVLLSARRRWTCRRSRR